MSNDTRIAVDAAKAVFEIAIPDRGIQIPLLAGPPVQEA